MSESEASPPPESEELELKFDGDEAVAVLDVLVAAGDPVTTAALLGTLPKRRRWGRGETRHYIEKLLKGLDARTLPLAALKKVAEQLEVDWERRWQNDFDVEPLRQALFRAAVRERDPTFVCAEWADETLWRGVSDDDASDVLDAVVTSGALFASYSGGVARSLVGDDSGFALPRWLQDRAEQVYPDEGERLVWFCKRVLRNASHGGDVDEGLRAALSEIVSGWLEAYASGAREVGEAEVLDAFERCSWDVLLDDRVGVALEALREDCQDEPPS